MHGCMRLADLHRIHPFLLVCIADLPKLRCGDPFVPPQPHQFFPFSPTVIKPVRCNRSHELSLVQSAKWQGKIKESLRVILVGDDLHMMCVHCGYHMGVMMNNVWEFWGARGLLGRGLCGFGYVSRMFIMMRYNGAVPFPP